MNDTNGHGHKDILIEGNLPETFQFRLHPAPSLEEIDRIENGSETVLLAWSHMAPPPVIEGFEMSDEWKASARSKVPEEGADLPDDEIAFGNLFLFSLPPRSSEPEGLPTSDEIAEALVTRSHYDLDEVHVLVREAVSRAREGMVTNPF